MYTFNFINKFDNHPVCLQSIFFFFCFKVNHWWLKVEIWEDWKFWNQNLKSILMSKIGVKVKQRCDVRITSSVNEELTTSDYQFLSIRCTCIHKTSKYRSTREDKCIGKVIHQSFAVKTGPPATFLIFSPSNDPPYHEANAPHLV